MPVFSTLAELRGDPILGLSAQFREDSRGEKIDLGVGVYRSEGGETPIMEAVREATALLTQQETTKAYLPPSGTPHFQSAVARLVLGSENSVLASGRVTTLQSVGGSGALHVGARLIATSAPDAVVWIGNPTWANHAHLLGSAGVRLKEYPYYDSTTHSLDFDGLCKALATASAGDVVLLHGCCHNPSGADLSLSQWHTLTELVSNRKLVPFIDIAYLGLGMGIDEDAAGLRHMAENVPEMLIAVSFSKNFGLYRERAGALIAVTEKPSTAKVVASHLGSIARGVYSMPPAHGCALVETILHSNELTSLWQRELGDMRERINGLRSSLAASLGTATNKRDFTYLEDRLGMFCYLGLPVDAVTRLRKEHAIYMVDSSRINVAGINQHNLPRLVEALVAVL